MQYGYASACEAHDPGELHWERPGRLTAIRETLAEYEVRYHDPPPASEAEVCSVHDPEYVSAMRAFCADGGGDWGNHTVVGEATWDAALASAGLATWAARRAVERQETADPPFALGRPPGHHATPTDAMGFCVFNNAAVAAQSVIDRGTVERVAILDWDIHHGNGTQDAFYDRADVLYLSLHDQGIYPCTGGPDETGTGAGAGTTCNVALPPGSGDHDYLAAVDRVIAPAVRAHDPGLLLVSAGFDLHGGDAVSRMTVSTDGIGSLAARTREVAGAIDAGLGFILEGGYDLAALTESIGMLHRVFGGYDPSLPSGEPSPAVDHLLDRLASRSG